MFCWSQRDKTDIVVVSMTTSSRKKTILVSTVAILGGLAAIALVAFNFERHLPVTKADREMLITTTDLAPWLESFEFVKKNERIAKVRYLDSSVDLEYEYENDDIYLSTMVSRERDRANAVMSFNAQWTGASLVMKFNEECHLKQADDFYSYGDSSHYATIMCKGGPGGNVFATMVGNTVFFLTMAGIYFDNPEDFTEFMAPSMAQLGTWKP